MAQARGQARDAPVVVPPGYAVRVGAVHAGGTRTAAAVAMLTSVLRRRRSRRRARCRVAAAPGGAAPVPCACPCRVAGRVAGRSTGCRVQSGGSRSQDLIRVQGTGYRVTGLDPKTSGWAERRGVPGAGCKGAGCKGAGAGYRVRARAVSTPEAVPSIEVDLHPHTEHMEDEEGRW